MKLLKLLANLGYGTRKEVERYLKSGAVTDVDGKVLGEKDLTPHDRILFKGEPLDPPAPLTIVLNKPHGYTCSTEDPDTTVYDLLPARFSLRNPGLSCVGRLDKETTGMLLMTDDGPLLHRIIHPKYNLGKVYHAMLDRPLQGHEAELFASGTLTLKSEGKPLLPAEMEILGEKEVLITLHEGRYHQVRRMFAAAGNHVLELKRLSIGGLKLPEDVEEGEWKILNAHDLDVLFGRTSA